MSNNLYTSFNSYWNDPKNDLVDKKKASVSKASQEKKDTLDWSTSLIYGDSKDSAGKYISGTPDGDGIFINAPGDGTGNDVNSFGQEEGRLSLGKGYSEDAWETRKSEEWHANPANKKKFNRQLKEASFRLGRPANREDVYAFAETAKDNFKKRLYEGQPTSLDQVQDNINVNEVDPITGNMLREQMSVAPEGPLQPTVETRYGKRGLYGRPLIEARNPYTGKSINQAMNNPLDNSSFGSKYNRQGRIDYKNSPEYKKEKIKSDGRSITDIAGDVMSGLGTGGTVVGTAAYGLADMAGRTLNKAIQGYGGLVEEGVKAILPEDSQGVKAVEGLGSKEYITPLDSSIKKEFGIGGYEYLSDLNKAIKDYWDSDKTKVERSEKSAAEKEYKSNAQERKNEVEEMLNPKGLKQGFIPQIADVVNQVQEGMHTGGQYLENPGLITSLIAEQAAQVLTGTTLAKQATNTILKQAIKKEDFGTKLTNKEVNKLLKNKNVRDEYSSLPGMKEKIQKAQVQAYGANVVAQESTGAASDVSSRIDDISHHDLMIASEAYRTNINNGMPEEQARNMAKQDGMLSAAIIAGMAAKFSAKEGSKFETSLGNRNTKLDVKKMNEGLPKTYTDKLIKKGKDLGGDVLRETKEEMLQGAGGTIGANVGVKIGADDEQEILEDVGSAVAESAIASAGTTAAFRPMDTAEVLGAGSAILAGKAVSKINPLKKVTKKVKKYAEKVVNASHQKVMDTGTTKEKADSLIKINTEGTITNPDQYAKDIMSTVADLKTELKESKLAEESQEYINLKASTNASIKELGASYKKVKSEVDNRQAQESAAKLKTNKSTDVEADTANVVNHISKSTLGNEPLDADELSAFQDEAMPKEVQEAAKVAETIKTLKDSGEVSQEVINDIDEATKTLFDGLASPESRTKSFEKATATFERLKNNQQSKLEVLETGLANYKKDPTNLHNKYVIYPATRNSKNKVIQDLVKRADNGDAQAYQQLVKGVPLKGEKNDVGLALEINPLEGKGTESVIAKVAKEVSYIDNLAGNLNRQAKQNKIDTKKDIDTGTERKIASVIYAKEGMEGLDKRIATMRAKKSLTKKELDSLQMLEAEKTKQQTSETENDTVVADAFGTETVQPAPKAETFSDANPPPVDYVDLQSQEDANTVTETKTENNVTNLINKNTELLSDSSQMMVDSKLRDEVNQTQDVLQSVIANKKALGTEYNTQLDTAFKAAETAYNKALDNAQDISVPAPKTAPKQDTPSDSTPPKKEAVKTPVEPKINERVNTILASKVKSGSTFKLWGRDEPFVVKKIFRKEDPESFSKALSAKDKGYYNYNKDFLWIVTDPKEEQIYGVEDSIRGAIASTEDLSTLARIENEDLLGNGVDYKTKSMEPTPVTEKIVEPAVTQEAPKKVVKQIQEARNKADENTQNAVEGNVVPVKTIADTSKLSLKDNVKDKDIKLLVPKVIASFGSIVARMQKDFNTYVNSLEITDVEKQVLKDEIQEGTAKQLQSVEKQVKGKGNDVAVKAATKALSNISKAMDARYSKYGYPDSATMLTNNTNMHPGGTMETVGKGSITSVSLKNMVGAKSKIASSVLGMIPNFKTLFSSQRVSNNPVLTELGITGLQQKSFVKNVEPFINEFSDIYKNSVSIPYIQLDAAKSRKDSKGKRVPSNKAITTLFKNPLQLFTSAPETRDPSLISELSGILPENITSAMALVAYNFLGTKASNSNFNSPRQINAMLGRPAEAPIPDNLLTLLSTAGMPRTEITKELGRAVLEQLNLSTLKNLDDAVGQNLVNSIGLSVLETLNKMKDAEGDPKYIKITKLPKQLLTSEESEGVSGESLIFIATATEYGEAATGDTGMDGHPEYDSFFTDTDALSEVKDYMSKTGDNGIEVFNALFNLKAQFELPPETPTEHVTTSLKGTINKVDSVHSDAIEEQQKYYWTPKKGMNSLFNLIPDNLKKGKAVLTAKLFGYNDNIDNTVHIEDRAGAEAKNLSIISSLTNIGNFLKERGSEGIFYDILEAYRTTRIGYKNQGLDAQQDKIVRHFFRGENFVHSISLNNNEQDPEALLTKMVSYYAILEGVGVNADELTVNGEAGTTTVMDAFADLLSKVHQEGHSFNSLYKAYSSRLDATTGDYSANAVPFSESEYNALLAAVNDAGKGAVSVDSIESLMRVAFAIENDIDSIDLDIGAEIDGKTNGYAIVLLQWADTLSKSNLAGLNRSGVYLEGDDHNSFAEFRNAAGSLDNYQASAKLSATEMAAIKAELMTPEGILNDFDGIKKEVSNLLPFNADSNSTKNEQIIHNFKFMPKAKKRAYLESAKGQEYFNAIQERIAVIERVMPDFNAETIDSKLRQLMKDPHMRGQYGQEAKSAIETVSEVLYQNFKNKLMSVRNDKEMSKEEKIKYLKDVSSMFAGEGSNFLLEESDGNIKDFRLDSKNSSLKDKLDGDFNVIGQETIKDVFKGAVGILAGKAIASAMENLMAETKQNRDLMVQSVKLMSTMETYAYNAKIKEWENHTITHKDGSTSQPNKGKIPNAMDRRKLLIELRDAGLQTSMPTPNSKDVSEYMPFTEFETGAVNSDNSDYKTQVSFKEPAQTIELGIEEFGEVFERGDAAPSKSFTMGISDNTVKPVQGVGSAVFSIFSLDSTIQALAMALGKHMLNVHDAVYSDVKSIVDLAMANNENYLGLNTDFRFMEATQTRLNDYIESFEKEFGKLDNAVLANDLDGIAQKYYNDLDGMDRGIDGKEASTFSEVMGNIPEQLEDSVNATNANFEALDFKTINQYVTPFSTTYGNGKKQRAFDKMSDAQLANNMVKEAKDNLGNENSSTTLADSMSDTYDGDPLGAETAGKIFEDLNKIAGKTEDSAHLEALQDMLDTLIIPALKASGNAYNVVRGSIEGDRNKGEFDPETDKIYLADAEGIATGEGMSTQETAIHEWVHAITFNALRDPANYHIKRRLSRLFRDSKKSLEDAYGDAAYEIFLDTDANSKPTFLVNEAQERATAKARYNYIFNNKKGYHLEEFISFGLSNAKLMNALTGLKPKTKKQITEWKATNFLKNLADIFSNLIDWITDKTFKNTNASSDVYLKSLVKDLSIIKQARVKQLGNGSNLIAKANSALQEHVISRIGTAWKKESDRLNKNPSKKGVLGSAYSLAVNIPVAIYDKDFRAQIDNIAYKFNLTKTNFAYKLLNTELLKTAEENQVWEDMLRNSKHTLDKARNETIISTSNAILDAYAADDRPSKKESMAITLGMLKTDLDALMDDYTIDEIVRLYVSGSVRKEEIAKIESELKTLDGNTFNYYQTLGKSLGNMMVSGRTGMRGQSLNAHNIANMSAIKTPYLDEETGRKQGLNITNPPANPEKAEEILDRLISLYAIDSLTGDTRSMVAKRMKSEYARDPAYNGISMTLGVHRKVKTDAKEKIFKGNKSLFIKGYTKEQFDPNIDFKIGTALDDFSSQRYVKLPNALRRDENMPQDIKSQYMWINKDALVNTTISGIMGKVNMQNKGQDVVSLLANQGEKGIPAAAHSYRIANSLNKAAREDLMAAYKGKLVLDYDKTYVVPIPDVDGSASGYRYMMDEEQKNSLLNKEDLAHKVLGNMAGNILDKVETKKIGSDVLRQAKKEYKMIGQTQAREFTYIGKDAKETINQERWAMLPKDVQREMQKQWKDNGMYIRTELLDIVFGYRKFSLGDLKLFKHKALNVNVRIIENIIQEVVKVAKRKIVILTPDVLKGNVMSNTMLLLVGGVPIMDIVRDSKVAIRALNDHRDIQYKRDKLQIKLNAIGSKLTDPQKQKIKNQLIKYDAELKTNPVTELVDEGLFQSIVEDVDIQEASYIKSRVGRIGPVKGLLDKYEEKGGIFKEAIEQATIDPVTESYDYLMKATQYSDFVARYTMYQYQTKKLGMSREESVRDIMSTFINYDLPSSKELQYVNDMGWLMYTKFFFRIQRIIWKMWMDKPANSLALLGVQELLGDVADISDSLITPNGVYDRFDFNPISQVDDATDVSSLNYLFNWF